MDEKLKILEMIESGKISAKEGLDLLKALEGETHTEVKKIQGPSSGSTKKYLRIRVRSEVEDVKNVNINIPLKLARLASKFVNLVPKTARDEMEEQGIRLEDLKLDEIIDTLEEDAEPLQLVAVKGDGVNVDISIE